MASSRTARLTQRKCELCETNNIQWKCLTCEEIMCDQCKKSHLKSKVARDYKVKLLDDKASLHLGVVKNSNKCMVHTSEDVQMFCTNCEIMVCTECIVSGSHQNHCFSKLQDIVKTKYEELTKIKETLKQAYSTFSYSINAIDVQKLDYSKVISDLKNEIMRRNLEIKSYVDEKTNELLKQVQDIETENQKKIKEAKEQLQKSVYNLKSLIKECEIKDKNNKVEFVRFVSDVATRMEDYKSCLAPDPLTPPVFVKQTTDSKTINDMFGYLESEEEKGSDFDMTYDNKISTKVKIKSEFSLQNVNIVAAINEDEAWVGCWGRSDVVLVSKEGKVIEYVSTNFDIYDMAVNTTGVLLATVCEGDRIKAISKGEICEDLYIAPDSYQTRGLTVTDGSDIIVCLYNHHKGEGCLIHLLPNGQQLQTIQYDTDGKTPLFTFPWNVSENKNGDLIVTQRGGVIAVDRKGMKRFEYIGKHKGLKSKISPGYTVTDKHGNILISDHVNSVIHLLDEDGQFKCFILSEINGLQEPRGLSLDSKGRLWVCSRGNDKIMVIEY